MKQIQLMKQVSTICALGVLALGVSNAIAQPAATSSATKSEPVMSASDSSKPSMATQVDTWTTKQWNVAKKEWAKDKIKWSDCQKQSQSQKLEGRKSWAFLYKCMTN